ncbi:DNA N-6-adenine-methyltransferase (Dam) [compost metagenome]|jgi:hypothetical protein|uniref:phage N-6-adenine-methyltransferase n=1 Tax=Stenotrophomonas TaxID=40323 RepID=UPI000F906BF7|nr:phage N-6-adenine-methyltransferase [Stenotrophomonas sp. PA-6-5C]
MADGESYIDWYGKGRKQNWRTPRGMFDALNAEFGFTMDGASEPGNGLLPVASTAEAPISWAGQRVFCNPPWSNIRPFIDLAVQAEVAVFLVPARTLVGSITRWISEQPSDSSKAVRALNFPSTPAKATTVPSTVCCWCSKRSPPMADQLLTTALTWGIAGSLFLLVAGAFWLARQAYRAARAWLRWCWRRCAHG